MAERKEYFLKKIYPEHLAEMRAIGRRIVDVRVQDPLDNEKRYSEFRENDWLHFEDTNHEVLKASVRYCRHYDSIENLLINEGIENVWPNAKTLKEAIELSVGFPGYAENIEKNGVYSLCIKKLAVYVAGPYSGTRKEKIRNIKNAEKIAREVAKMGYIPLVPHKLFEFWEDEGFGEKACMALEKDLLQDKSDFFYFINPSNGTNKELAMAREIMPIFISLENLRFWKPVKTESKSKSS
ncbi:MAG: DUF4406 domain-containing protein [archaeon]